MASANAPTVASIVFRMKGLSLGARRARLQLCIVRQGGTDATLPVRNGPRAFSCKAQVEEGAASDPGGRGSDPGGASTQGYAGPGRGRAYGSVFSNSAGWFRGSTLSRICSIVPSGEMTYVQRLA